MESFTNYLKLMFPIDLSPSLVPSLLLCFLCISTSSANANENTNIDPIKSEITAQSIYKNPFFEQYLPQNAFEMVQRLPGFNFDEGENNRGFGGNAGNVLVDGARPTSKSGGLKGALIRIPAAQVDYIEIIRGGVSAGEASGQSIVANVVRRNEGSSGTWAAKLRRAPDGRIIPNIELAISTDIGDWKTAFDADIGGFPGFRTALIEDRDANGNLNKASNENFTHRDHWLLVNGEGSTKVADGLFTLNTRLGGSEGNFDTEREVYINRQPDLLSPDQALNIDEKNDSKIAELGVDWVGANNDWKLHLIGLAVINDQQYGNQVSFENFIDDDFSSSKFSQDSEKTEFISRATYGFIGSENFKPEYGIEIAQNKLTSNSNYSENGVAIALNGANVEVEELRSEIFASFTYQVNDKFSLEGGLTGEFSKIEVSGESRKKQTFQFIKPRLSGTYKINKSSQLAIVAERKVGQLNFSDFAASNDAADDNIFSGNPDLAPDTSDELSATYDWSFSELGSLKVKIFHHWRKNILEQIILPFGGQGLGNAGNATFWGIETDLNLPIDWILKNGLLEISRVYRDSKFDDPIISGVRNINGYTPNWLKLELRQDIVKSKIAWGIEYSGSFTDTNYSVNERVTFSGNKRLRIFVETSRYFGVKTQLEVSHLNTGDYTRSRYIHTGDRGNSLARTEVAFRHRKPEIKLSVFGTF